MIEAEERQTERFGEDWVDLGVFTYVDPKSRFAAVVNRLAAAVAKFNPNHGPDGKFTSGPGGGATFGEYTLPDTVYHGTTADFDQFATPAMFSVNHGYSATLVQGNAGAKVIPVKLTLKNPADLRAMHLSPSDPNFREVAQRLQAQGYDSAHYRGEAWIAFSPEQITRLDKAPGVKEFATRMESKGIKVDLAEKGDLITLSRIVVPESQRGTGLGTQAMQELTALADQAGKRIALTPSTDFGATSKRRLEQFYTRFGFKPNAGKQRDFSTRETMIREPRR
jgi:GNAT superfamily N-acetyltransferase